MAVATLAAQVAELARDALIWAEKFRPSWASNQSGIRLMRVENHQQLPIWIKWGPHKTVVCNGLKRAYSGGQDLCLTLALEEDQWSIRAFLDAYLAWLAYQAPLASDHALAELGNLVVDVGFMYGEIARCQA